MNASLEILTEKNLKVGLCSLALARNPRLNGFLQLQGAKFRATRFGGNFDLYVGWGNRPSGQRAKALASRTGRPFVLLEDAFVRSFAPKSVYGEPETGIVIDNQGIYYDASGPSRLENLIVEHAQSTHAKQSGKTIAKLLRKHQVCKYNNYARPDDRVAGILADGGVLVVDQTFADLSVAGAQADATTFQRMFEAAFDENPRQQIIVKLHPEVLSGKKKGYLKDLALRYDCHLLTENINPWHMFKTIDTVYVVSSQLGFDAAISGCAVRCFGQPFYSGWGVTQDDQSNQRRQSCRPGIERIVHAAYADYARYINVHDQTPATAEQAIEQQAFLTANYSRNSEIAAFYQVIFWKQARVKAMFSPFSSKRLFFLRLASAIRAAKHRKGVLVAWASRINDKAVQLCRQNDLDLWRLEDGFIRSVGLGTQFNLPMSLILDKKGIYYDPRTASDLEDILNTSDFGEDVCGRARNLRESIIGHNITKYNLAGSPDNLDLPRDKKIILVPGQVEDDASVELGGGSMTGLELLDNVRSRNPDAMIIFKPHPDVMSGLRDGLMNEQKALKFADLFTTDVPIEALVDTCDEVHTISSLTGFEALLRKKPVTCYGMPFYAGWGITTDMVNCDRRTAKLSLDELVAGTLIMYPTYFDPVSGLPCDPELVISRILEQRENPPPPSLLTRFRTVYGALRKSVFKLTND